MTSIIKRIRSKKIYHNPWMTVREDAIIFPNGHKGIFSVVERGDFSLIIPFENNSFYLVKQYRYSIGRYTWEFPQGRHEKEPQINTGKLASLELKEETGLEAKRMRQIGNLFAAPGYSTQRFMVFLASGLTMIEAQPDSTEVIEEVKKFSVSNFEEMIGSGEIRSSVTISAYGLLKAHKYLK